MAILMTAAILMVLLFLEKILHFKLKMKSFILVNSKWI